MAWTTVHGLKPHDQTPDRAGDGTLMGAVARVCTQGAVRIASAAVVALVLTAAVAPMALADTDSRGIDRNHTVYGVPDTDAAQPFIRNTQPNIFQRLVRDVMGLFGPSDIRRTRSSRLNSAFAELEDYQDLYRQAAGWNGDRFFQFRLGLMFETGNGAVAANPAAAYYFYSLSAAQNYREAQDRRDILLQGNRAGVDLSRREMREVYEKFIETYVFGGSEAQFRLGQVLEGTFFNNALHDQDALDEAENRPRQRLINAYAAYLMAEQGGHPNAERAREALVSSERLSAAEQEAGRYEADDWARWIGLGDKENPFRMTEQRMETALSRGSDFQDRRSEELKKRDDARSWLMSGRSFEARGDVKRAKIAYETAIDTSTGSRAALDAQQALQALTTTCSAAPRDHPTAPLSKVKMIDLKAQQFALRALGHYEGPIDGDPGPMTRYAVRSFLGSLNVDPRDYLSAEQIVELICTASQLRGHAPSQNMLGRMYALGIGVIRDEELARYWFSQAAQQRFPSAVLNMGRMYARVRGLSEEDRDHPQNCAIAESYFREAHALGHPAAARELARLGQQDACKLYGRRRG